MDSIVHYNIRVEGDVQGVFYRANTEEKARQLHVNGFIRNEPDGSVYMEAEGDQKAVDDLIEWCHEGPPGARVTQVKYAPDEHLSGFRDFTIKR